MKKTIGILGGMGPEATSYFFSLLIKLTSAQKDQDHIPIILYNNPKIPPRTDSLMKNGPSPVPYLLEGARILKHAGADFVVMPCVTIHLFLPSVLEETEIPFVDIIEETSSWIQNKLPRIRTAGLLSSSGTMQSRVFHNALSKKGITVIHPSEKQQGDVMEAIFGKKGIKAGFTRGRSRSTVLKAAQQLVQQGAESVISGCTEIPLVLKQEDLDVPLIDPLRVGAEACITLAGYDIKLQTEAKV